jgi:hypothetical protein
MVHETVHLCMLSDQYSAHERMTQRLCAPQTSVREPAVPVLRNGRCCINPNALPTAARKVHPARPPPEYQCVWARARVCVCLLVRVAWESMSEEVYEIGAVLDVRSRPRKQYLVSWKGYSKAHDTWEPAAEIHAAAPDLVEALEEAKKKKNKTPAKKRGSSRSPSPSRAPRISLSPRRSSSRKARSPSPAPPADTADADAVRALLPGDGDAVWIKWAGSPYCVCILKRDSAGDLIPEPLDGSWADDSLVFDPAEDDWKWASDEDVGVSKAASVSASDTTGADISFLGASLVKLVALGAVVSLTMCTTNESLRKEFFARLGLGM